MKYVLMIGGETAPLIYFTNFLAESKMPELIILEQKTNNSAKQISINNTKHGFLEKLLRYALFKLDLQKLKRQRASDELQRMQQCQAILKDRFESFQAQLPILYTDDINSNTVVEKLKSIQPDLVIDHGTSLVKNEVISLAKLALNVHWGLSPYYRGVNCTERALLNWDPYNIGVTVHKLAKEIDGGAILCQRRIPMQEDDTVHSIELKMSKAAAEICKMAIEKMQSGIPFTFVQQQTEIGYLVRGIHWNQEHHNWVHALSLEMKRKMLEKPSRGAVAIVEW